MGENTVNISTLLEIRSIIGEKLFSELNMVVPDLEGVVTVRRYNIQVLNSYMISNSYVSEGPPPPWLIGSSYLIKDGQKELLMYIEKLPKQEVI